MLGHLIRCLATPASLAIRRSGHVGASVALQGRARRCRRAWAPHFAETKATILSAVSDLGTRRVAMVLGSGPLGDVPLAALAAAFERVLLVDTVHPWSARRAMAHYANVARLTADLAAAPLEALLDEPSLDLVVSANLLSQLPILPVERAERWGGEGGAVGHRIVAGHLAALARTTARVCLVTDVRQREEGRSGRELDALDLLHGVAMPAPTRVWDWELAPFGEVARDRRLVHRVHAYADWRRTVAA